MIEVFKTNVTERIQAALLVSLIHRHFPEHEANFDLEDCDKILRVEHAPGAVDTTSLIHLINRHGFDAEPLP